MTKQDRNWILLWVYVFIALGAIMYFSDQV